MDREARNRVALGLISLLLLPSLWCSCFGDESNAHLTALASCVWRQRADVKTEASSSAPLDVRSGDRLLVDDTGRGRLEFPDLVTVEVYRTSDLTLRAEPTTDSLSVDLYLTVGAIFCDVPPSERVDRRITVDTEWAQIKATGTGFAVQYEPDTQTTWVGVLRGQVMVSAQGQSITAADMQMVRVDPGQPPTELPAHAERMAQWLEGLGAGYLLTVLTATQTPAIPTSTVVPEMATDTWTPTPTAVPQDPTTTPVPTGVPTTTPPPTGVPTKTRTPTGVPTTTPPPTGVPTKTRTPTGVPTKTPTPRPPTKTPKPPTQTPTQPPPTKTPKPPTRTPTQAPPTKTPTLTPIPISAVILFYEFDAASSYATFHIVNGKISPILECVKARIVDRNTNVTYYGGPSGYYSNAPFYPSPTSTQAQDELSFGDEGYLRYKLTDVPYGSPCRATFTLYTADNLGGISTVIVVDFDAGIAPW